ncbi:hypothetical protein KVT40_000846 [Elsinoe batatas]|uniref:Uncharacterized protein n=1 Tax=Elsinoe batatas TaxID=2601811 RepID=A0A8K0L831_9PEZI|nr:hypothetical protein KVT40_000846 [Elsinoe batatas]
MSGWAAMSGWTAVLYKGRYYADHHVFDIADVVGDIVAGIPTTSSTAYQGWRTTMMAKHEHLHNVFDTEVRNLEPGELERFYVVTTDLAEDCHLIRPPFIWLPNHPDAWTLVIDLDSDILLIDQGSNRFRFHLDKLPDLGVLLHNRWPYHYAVPFDVLDCAGNLIRSGVTGLQFQDSESMAGRFQQLQLLCEHYARVSDNNPEGATISIYNSMGPKIVTPRESARLESGTQISRSVSDAIYSQWMHGLSELPQCLWRLTEQDVIFKEIVWATVHLLCGTNHSLAIEKHTEWREYWPTPWKLAEWMYSSALDEDGDQKEWIPLMGHELNARLPDQSIFNAPVESFYWHAGVLIHLCATLHFPSNAKAAIAKMVQHGRTNGKSSFHGIILSITHVVLVKVFDDGHIEHTHILKLLPQADDFLSRDLNRGRAVNNTLGLTLPAVISAQLHIDESIDAFAAVHHLFEAAANEKCANRTSSTKDS